MKLYYYPGACSLAPHIVAREAGIPLSLEKVDLANRTTETGANYATVNPKGYVPALGLQDGSVLTEASAIVQYLADQQPGTDLAPAPGTMERYRLLEWLGFISTEIHKGFGPLWNPATPDAVKAATKERLATRFAYLDEALAKQPYLMGETFTIADAYLFTVVNWTNFHAVDISPFPNLKAFQARIASRPSVQQALEAEGLVKKAA
ncbi:glutathione transferase GstA [Microvirga sp. 3-52]|jgi:glutathione S-transferase|uniref:glutathione transferase GstA n=1 Tax=Microvirga sp. 3-52 TaxID=2792425 RepID=UPI001AD1F7D7|nr:glutathione transferase GstA [Microvirga sp. 3-52]MBO1906935.1 glutathione transferase GstA [Microvirga sp. 3-52]MBS7454030.1 glutathione transferase GstA [Microvirga sp. 3-52]